MLQDITQFIDFAWRLFLYWWWLPAFFWLVKKFDEYWRWWRVELWYGTIWKPMLLEIKIPKEQPKPIKAMEAVFVALHGAIYNDPDWWEKYGSGEPQTSYKFELVSIDGVIHFYVRCFADYRDAVEAAIYSQFPEAEIEVVPDYSRQIPIDIPNKGWDLFGWDYKMLREPQFPIPTYEQYVEHGIEQEEVVDPFNSLMESMAKLKKGEQIWIQISARPIYISLKEGKDFVKKGEHLRDVLAKRIEEKKSLPPLWKELLDFIIVGAKKEEEKPQELFPAEMRLTTGERQTIEAVEHKIAKPFFSCYVRNMYLGRREVFFKPNFRLLFNYFNHFTNPDINSLWIWTKTLTRVKKTPIPFVNTLSERRTYVKKRRLLRMYRDRLNYYAPWGESAGDVGAAIRLNVEELATLFHFPSQIVAPTPGIQRVEARETVPPPNLPI